VFRNLEQSRSKFCQLVRLLLRPAIHSDSTNDIELLLQHEAVIDHLDAHAVATFVTNKSTHPICFPACEGYSNIVERLAGDHGRLSVEALQQASFKGHEAGVRHLLEHRVPDDDVPEALYTAAVWKRRSIVELILKLRFEGEDEAASDALREARQFNSWTSLFHVALAGHEVTTQLFLHLGADIEAKHEIGRTALHHASSEGHEATIRLLLDRDADIESKDKSG
jgi:ankyrin repeat protein